MSERNAPSERVNDVTPMPSSGPIIRAEEPSAYTPSTEEVKASWVKGGAFWDARGHEFDRWLAEHDQGLLIKNSAVSRGAFMDFVRFADEGFELVDEIRGAAERKDLDEVIRLVNETKTYVTGYEEDDPEAKPGEYMREIKARAWEEGFRQEVASCASYTSMIGNAVTLKINPYESEES